MHKPYSSAPLSEHHVRIGVLVSFANEVNRNLDKKEMNPMGNLYVFDDRAEIRTPAKVPENWPTGFIRIYTEQARSTKDVDFTLHNFEPSNWTAGYDAKRGGSLDAAGLRLVSENGFNGLEAHYMVIPEFNQLSFVPFIGHFEQSPEEILEASKLPKYDQKQIMVQFEEGKIIDEYDGEEDLEHFRGVPHTYHNWILLNALILSKIVTLRALALAEHAENVYAANTGNAPVDVSGETDVIEGEVVSVQ